METLAQVLGGLILVLLGLYLLWQGLGSILADIYLMGFPELHYSLSDIPGTVLFLVLAVAGIGITYFGALALEPVVKFSFINY